MSGDSAAHLWNLDDGEGIAAPPGLLTQQLQAPAIHSSPGSLRQPATTEQCEGTAG